MVSGTKIGLVSWCSRNFRFDDTRTKKGQRLAVT